MNLDKWKARCFIPYLWDPEEFNGLGCGISAVALLTGVSPLKIEKKFPCKNLGELKVFDNRWMLRVLRHFGLDVYKIGKIRLEKQHICDTIKSNHVVLCSQQVLAKEATWQIFHRDRCYHNFSSCRSLPLDFINYPIVHGPYLVWNQKWAG